MVKVSGKTADFNLQMTGAQKAGGSREVSDDFRKLLQGKQNAAAEDSKGSTEGKKDTKPTEDQEASVENTKEEKTQKDDVQAEGLLTMYQMGQDFRPELVQLPPETAAGIPAEEAVPIVTEELPGETAKGEEIPAETVLPTTGEEVFPARMAEAVEQPTVEVKQSAPAEEAIRPDLQKIAPEDVRPGQKVEQSPARQNTKQEDMTGEQEQADDSMMQQAAMAQVQQPAAQGVQKEVFSEENVVRMQIPQPEELPEKVTDQILSKVTNGVTEFEIHIEPENLGKIAVKILYQAGQATVSILCSEKRTLDLLGNNAREIGNVLQKNLGGETTIIVEKQETDYLHQNREENQQNRQDAQQQQKKEQDQKQNAEDAEQFLQRLRLGLMG